MSEGLLKKYFGEEAPPQAPYDNLWPGTVTGAPIRVPRGARPLTTDEEMDEVETASEFKSRRFNLLEPGQKAEYDSIMDRILNHRFQMVFIYRHIDPAQGITNVYLEWDESFGMLPADARKAAQGGANAWTDRF